MGEERKGGILSPPFSPNSPAQVFSLSVEKEVAKNQLLEDRDRDYGRVSLLVISGFK